MSEIWQQVRCAVCGGPFENEDHWFDRHDDPDGADIHAECCAQCLDETRALNQFEERRAQERADEAEGRAT